MNTKMTISQEPLVEIDSTLCHNKFVSCMKPFFFCFFFVVVVVFFVFFIIIIIIICNLAFQNLLKIAQNMKMTISQ